MKKLTRKTAAIMAAVLAIGALLTGCGSNAEESKGTIVVGSKDFSENLILSEVYALALEDAGFEVKRSFGISSMTVHTAIVNDEIDLYPEYTGTGLIGVLQHDLETDPQKVYDIVKEEYKEKFNIVWLDYTKANDSEGLAVSTKVSEEYGITTISDLQKYSSELRLATVGEENRADGLPLLEAVYGPFEFKDSVLYSPGLRYELLKNDDVDVVPITTTEGWLNYPEVTVLEDDKHAWPPYNAAPIVRGEVLEKYPEIEDILNSIDEHIDTETLIELNGKVDVDQEEYEDVAKEFYESIK